MIRQVQSRRNIGNKQHREMWEEMQEECRKMLEKEGKEYHPMHYRLHFKDKTSMNLKCDKVTLLKAVEDTKPEWFERIAGNHSHIMNFSECCIGLLQRKEFESVEVHDNDFLKNSSECSGYVGAGDIK